MLVKGDPGKFGVLVKQQWEMWANKSFDLLETLNGAKNMVTQAYSLLIVKINTMDSE